MSILFRNLGERVRRDLLIENPADFEVSKQWSSQKSDYSINSFNFAMATRDASTPIETFDKESLVKRNPHEDFALVEASRLPYSTSRPWTFSKTPNPTWQPGDGSSTPEWRSQKHLTINPSDPIRSENQNYKLIISSTVPRPIALVSTITPDGKTKNLAPFSYFNTVSVDPPLYSVSFVGREKNDSLRNLEETGECCISMISDWFLEAANFTSVNTARCVSEWPLSGLHPVESEIVRPPYVAESAFSMECKVHSSHPIFSKTEVDGEDKPVRTATMVLVEAVMWHVWEGIVDEKLETVDVIKLRAVWRGGGITYGSAHGVWETRRPEAMRKLMEMERVKGIMEEMTREES